jgi:putative acetyltransferase
MDGFAPGRALYQRHGFSYCSPFADYREDPNSVFMTRVLAAEPSDIAAADAKDSGR